MTETIQKSGKLIVQPADYTQYETLNTGNTVLSNHTLHICCHQSVHIYTFTQVILHLHQPSICTILVSRTTTEIENFNV